MRKEFIEQFEQNEHDRFHRERVAERRRRNGFHDEKPKSRVVSDHVYDLIQRFDSRNLRYSGA